jgi:hypothetical protein
LIPLNDAAIAAVEAIARFEGQTPLTITGSGGHIITDSLLIAGVVDVAHVTNHNNDNSIGITDESGNEAEAVTLNKDDDDDSDSTSDENNEDDGNLTDTADDEIESNEEDERDPEAHFQEYASGGNEPSVRRSERIRSPPVTYESTMHGPSYEPTVRGHNLAQIGTNTTEYKKEAIVMAHIMNQWNKRMCTTTIIQCSLQRIVSKRDYRCSVRKASSRHSKKCNNCMIVDANPQEHYQSYGKKERWSP